jgi:hypothetical protein
MKMGIEQMQVAALFAAMDPGNQPDGGGLIGAM